MDRRTNVSRMKKIKISRVDSVFSKAVRAAADYQCARCGEYHTHNSSGLHCSHFFSRSLRSVRWHPLNVAAHCMGCHSYLGGNPIEFTDWIKNHLGDDYPKLIELKNRKSHFRDRDRKEIIAHYKSELERIESLRSEGVTGRIELNPWTGE